MKEAFLERWKRALKVEELEELEKDPEWRERIDNIDKLIYYNESMEGVGGLGSREEVIKFLIDKVISIICERLNPCCRQIDLDSLASML